jgi:hypothetical protein
MKRALPLSLCMTALGCRDLSSFTTNGDRYDGPVVQGDFVRAGVGPFTTLCLTLDTDHLQDAPGALSTSDQRFQSVPMRPIPQIWHDPLSTFSFGEGRLKNLLYVVTATTPFGDGRGDDVFVVVSLLQSGGVEVRLLRGAPGVVTEAGVATGPRGNLFAVFDLERKSGPCLY